MWGCFPLPRKKLEKDHSLVTLLFPSPAPTRALLYPHPASLGPGINISLGQHTAPIVSTEGGMGAEGGGSAWGHGTAHNEAILFRRRGLPHPVPRHPVLSRCPPLSPQALGSDE